MRKLLSPILLFGLLSALSLIAQTAPTHATTTKKSAVAIGSGSFTLVKGTKLEIVAREGDMLVVKYRSLQGRIPVADTDFPADGSPAEAAARPATPVPAAKATPVVTKPAAPTPPAKTAPPPALDPAGRPATNYGKAVQKARQASESHKSTHVDPTKDILDEEPPTKK